MKKGLDSLRDPHTDSVKSLSRINPMCHGTGWSSPPACLFFMMHSMQYELDYTTKTADVLKQVDYRKKSMNEKNTSTTLDNTTNRGHVRFVDSSTLVCSLSSHRHSFIGFVFSSRFNDS
jgi:hypothetical protein